MGRLHAGANGCVLIKLMGSRSRWQWRVIGATIVAIHTGDTMRVCYPCVIVFYCFDLFPFVVLKETSIYQNPM